MLNGFSVNVPLNHVRGICVFTVKVLLITRVTSSRYSALIYLIESVIIH